MKLIENRWDCNAQVGLGWWSQKSGPSRAERTTLLEGRVNGLGRSRKEDSALENLPGGHHLVISLPAQTPHGQSKIMKLHPYSPKSLPFYTAGLCICYLLLSEYLLLRKRQMFLSSRLFSDVPSPLKPYVVHLSISPLPQCLPPHSLHPLNIHF